jgi:2-oxoglutarate/2-oxoacid ferredoxin oxidoreductase subunit beta
MNLIEQTIKGTTNVSTQKYTFKDFQSDQEVRWCPGCGDYSILAQTQRIFPELGIPKEKTVFVSGIGCSSRFPYYMNTYGFHGIHGRATAIASGLKIARPDLSVWVATGDGDGMSIGGNHFIHACRRNVGIKILLFNNQIYGLTKGQFSPTSVEGQVTKSTPYGNIDHPFNPLLLAMGAEATFVARTLDRDPKHMQYIIKRAAEHNGTAFVEIYQNCNVFNNGAFELWTEKDTKDENVVVLEQGKPMIFGKNKDKGIWLNGFTPEVVSLTDGTYTVNDLIVHNENDPMLAFILAGMSNIPNLPRPIGVVYVVEKPSYDSLMQQQIDARIAKQGKGDLQKLFDHGETWEIQ